MVGVSSLFPDTFGHKRIHYPLEELAVEIKQEIGFKQGLILSPETSLAAGLKLNFKDSFVVTSRIAFKPRLPYSKVLLIWNARWDHVVPDRMKDLLVDYNIDYRKANARVKEKKVFYKHSKKEYYSVAMAVIDPVKE